MKRKSVIDIKEQKGKEPIVCLTAYTAPIARAVDKYVDVLLVGDSLGMVLYEMSSGKDRFDLPAISGII